MIVEGFPEGAGFSDIQRQGAGLGLPRRTLARRLQALVDEGQLRTAGRGRALRYHLTEAAPAQASPGIPLSTEGREIQSLVRRPRLARTPVGYSRDFLEAYRPNETSYLTAAERSKLAEIGRSPVGGERPAGTYARNILGRLLIDLSWNSSRLEGNTYSLLDTKRLIEFGAAAEGKSRTDAQMIMNHKEAIEYLVGSAGKSLGFDRRTILNLHGLLANNLLPDPRAPGRLRSIEVNIGQSVFTPLAVPQMVEECFNLILEKAAAISDPYEQSFFAMVQLPYLQPFDDVNKRVSRLAANIPYLKHNLSPLSFTDVPERDYIDGMLGVYELNRIALLKDVYMWAYQRSANHYAALRQSVSEPDPFRIQYKDAIQSVVGHIVLERLTQSAAAKFIDASSAAVPATDRPRFVETVQRELLSLHEGNIARYRISSAQFDAWQAVWSRG